MKIMKPKTLSQTGELALLKRLCRRLPSRGDVMVGAGDDCAVVSGAPSDQFDYLLKSDSCVENVHFNPQTRGEMIGHKALGRVLSDMAAMGGEPLWVLVDLVAPPKTPLKRVEQIYAGMTRLAVKFNVAIVGGDVSAGRDLQLHVFGIARVQRGRAVLRSGARIGEAIFVTGRLGASLVGKHLEFQPRLREGQWLAGGWATAMIDISDGLLRDLGHITAASRVGARLDLDAIPISPAARRCSCKKSPLSHALGDGEDFELLFTVPDKKTDAFLKAWRRKFKLPCARIGTVTRHTAGLAGIDPGGRKIKLPAAGFEHFCHGKAQSGKGT